jgi:hypothetical protein
MTEPTPTSPDTGRETRVVDVKGRAIVVRQLKDTQILFLNREAILLSRGGLADDRVKAGMRRVLDVLESQVVQDIDKEYLMDLVALGDLELADLMGFVKAFREDDAEPEKPKVRRGRRPTVR